MKNSAAIFTKFRPWLFRQSGKTVSVGLVAMSLLSFTAGDALAGKPVGERTMYLHVKNIDSKPVTIQLIARGCYEGQPGNGQKWNNLASGSSVKIWLARIQGHDCDGEQGYFNLKFAPPVGGNEIQAFEFDNAKHLKMARQVNRYPGVLSAKAKDGSYTYTTYAWPKITAGKAKGNWDLLCQGNCNEEYSTTVENQTTHETTVSKDTKTAVSVALEAGFEFEGIGSAKTTVTSSSEESIGKLMSRGVMNSQSNTKKKNILRSADEMRKNNIFAFWQWVATTELSNGETILIKTDMITCTSDGISPNYLPGSKEDIGSCYGASSSGDTTLNYFTRIWEFLREFWGQNT